MVEDWRRKTKVETCRDSICVWLVGWALIVFVRKGTPAAATTTATAAAATTTANFPPRSQRAATVVSRPPCPTLTSQVCGGQTAEPTST